MNRFVAALTFLATDWRPLYKGGARGFRNLLG
jgi:hypothetical protein